MTPHDKQYLARQQGRNDAVHRIPPRFRWCAYDELYEFLRGTYRYDWVAVEDPTEAIAYIEGYEEGRKP